MAAAKQHAGVSDADGSASLSLLSGDEGSEVGSPLVYSRTNVTVCEVAQLLQWQFCNWFGKAHSTRSLPVALRASNKTAEKQAAVTVIFVKELWNEFGHQPCLSTLQPARCFPAPNQRNTGVAKQSISERRE